MKQMSKKQHNIELDYILRVIDLKKIDPSPYQVRKHFDEDKLKELAATIRREGLIGPIMVRLKGGRYELIAGERRLRADRDYMGIKAIPAKVVKASDLQARRISAAENLQREDLCAIETIEGTVEMVDAELIEDREYASMGKKPTDRVKALLGKLDTIRRSKGRGSTFTNETGRLSNKFVGQVEKIFNNLPKPLEWRSFYINDFPILMDIYKKVQKISIQPQLSEKCSIRRSLLFVIRYFTRYHLDFDNSIHRNAKILRLSRLACPPSFWRACPPSFWRGWTQ